MAYGNQSNKTDGPNRINFYWDPSFPLVLLKQVHTVKNLSLSGLAVSHAIYNLKNPIKFVSAKSPSRLISLRDTFIQKHKNTELFKFYKIGLDYIFKTTDALIHDLGVITSKEYYLE